MRKTSAKWQIRAKPELKRTNGEKTSCQDAEDLAARFCQASERASGLGGAHLPGERAG